MSIFLPASLPLKLYAFLELQLLLQLFLLAFQFVPQPCLPNETRGSEKIKYLPPFFITTSHPFAYHSFLLPLHMPILFLHNNKTDSNTVAFLYLRGLGNRYSIICELKIQFFVRCQIEYPTIFRGLSLQPLVCYG